MLVSLSSSAATAAAVFRNKFATISILSTTPKTKTQKADSTNFSVRFQCRASLKPLPRNSASDEIDNGGKPTVILNSLRVLEWEKICDDVSSFAATSLGRQAIKEQLWTLDQTYEESLRLLEETNAAVEIHKYSDGVMDFHGIDVLLVRSAIEHARKGLPISGKEAIAVATLLQSADGLQISVEVAVKENADLYNRFMPLAQLILDWVTNWSLVKLILQLIDEEGVVRDSASSKVKQARARVQELERRLNQLMNSLIADELNKTPSLEVSNMDGRWCIQSGADQLTSTKGLLLTSGSTVGNIIEPLSAVPLNDELQHAKALVADAEAEVLLELTTKMQLDLDDLENLLSYIIHLDVVNARATYSLSFGGTCPDLLLPEDEKGDFSAQAHSSGNDTLKSSYSAKREWKLYLPKAYHPLLLKQHRVKLEKARKDVANANAEIRRSRIHGDYRSQKKEMDIDLQSLQLKVTELEKACPVPVDFFIAKNTRVLLITGPNTGGKTICLKTLGLAAMMAKSGLYVLCSEPMRIPWFDFVFADIGDEQSLSQSLSTFSGHLKQISDIRAKSTCQSFVLLDELIYKYEELFCNTLSGPLWSHDGPYYAEIGAGTNPLEGAALGMSILESFAEAGAFLSIATTHHGELKTLKYSNAAFENACMEFDEVNLKPTYKILWGVPGRSNAINIAERLGLPKVILDNARELYGAASAEIDEVIIHMEKFKQDIQEYTRESQNYLRISKDLHEKLLVTQRKLIEHGSGLRYRNWQQISEIASMARSILHKKMRQHRASVLRPSQPVKADSSHQAAVVVNQHSEANDGGYTATARTGYSPIHIKKSSSEITNTIPKVGDIVHVASLGTKATVVKVEPAKDEIVVQAGNLKLKLKINAIKM